MGSHTGTHVDAPVHMIKGGKRLSDFDVSVFIGNASVFEIPSVRSVGPNELARFDWTGVERVLLKTENSKLWQDPKFHEDFVYLEPEGAQFLVDRGIRLVGIDYLSIDKFHSEHHPSHFVLLTKDIVILEGLNLNAVPAGTYSMSALPLNLKDADGAPTRVILTNQI
jgi:arylformamidase